MQHMLGADDLARDRLYGHIKARKGRTQCRQLCRYMRSLSPAEVRVALALLTQSQH